MLDVIVAGAGPAGSIAALVLARAGARVLIVDREVFPRHKLCGDTLNPGALSMLSSLALDVAAGPVAGGSRLTGMLVSGPRTSVRARYGDGIAGRCVPRAAFDTWLLEQAISAGARFESALVVRGPLYADASKRSAVRGLLLAQRSGSDRTTRIPAPMVIAADGSRSVLARALGLSRIPRHPRRWAFGVYVTDVDGLTDLGEMHVRDGVYLGIAPMPDGTANVCAVTGRPTARAPVDVMRDAIERAGASGRFRRATFPLRPAVLGPLAADVSGAGVEGLLVAGDAAGFVDPMTGDGLHLAMRGAVLAAQETLRSLESSDFAGAPERLMGARRRTLGAKLRFNRTIRAVAESPLAIELLSYGAAVVPGFMAPVVRYAGDVSSMRSERTAESRPPVVGRR